MDGYLKLADLGAVRGTAIDGFISAGSGETLSAAKTARLRACPTSGPNRRPLGRPSLLLPSLSLLAGPAERRGATDAGV